MGDGNWFLRSISHGHTSKGESHFLSLSYARNGALLLEWEEAMNIRDLAIHFGMYILVARFLSIPE